MTFSSLSRRGAIGLVLALALASTGCDVKERLFPGIGSRYTFAQDDQGRLVRLNKHTGELVLVESSLPQPVARRPRAAAPEVAVAEPAQPDATPDVPSEADTPDLTAQHTPAPTCPSPATFAEASHIRVKSTSPVFVEPRELRVPVATMTAGAVLPIAEVANDWLLVRFEDDQWGPRVGYIHCATVAIALESEIVATTAAR